jgi:hypothetical protein
MGIFSKVFGKKDTFDAGKYLEKILKIGGQAIAQVPIKKFSDYLREHGEQLPSHAGTTIGLLNINNETHRVEFSFGVFNGLNEGETLIKISRNSGIENAVSNGVDPIGLAEGMASVLTDMYIKNKNNAYSIVWQICTLSSMQYSGRSNGQFPSEDKNPARLQKYFDKVLDNGMLKDEFDDLSPEFDFFEINPVIESLTRDISDAELQLKINYAIAENLINKWDLDK